MTEFEPATWRRWVVPMAAIASCAFLAFGLFYGIDHYAMSGSAESPNGVFSSYFHFDPNQITDAVPALGGMIAAVLGIVITVVSIVVQLAAARYPGVANRFLRDRTNIGVMVYYVVTCVCGVLVSLSLRADFVPRATVIGMMGATTIGLVLMAPYFSYVFWFLEPTNIIARIRSEALTVATAGARTKRLARCEAGQAAVVSSLEELSDISSNSISGKDKIIASRAVDALKDFAVTYVSTKQSARADWFKLGKGIRDNPDFVAMEPESREDLVQRRTWVEWKVMRQYLGIYNEALGTMPDINYLIAIDTRYIGEAAAKADDTELIALVFRFMNSYLRSTLNTKNVRTAYNLLNQYRQLVDALITHGRDEAAARAMRYMKYYGHVSYDLKLSFVTETIAYDMGALCEAAHRKKSAVEPRFLSSFLELDRETSKVSHQQALKGVRKAQVKLAAYYLQNDARDQAREIFADMESDPPERLEAIFKELDGVESKDFWEIIDRGRNFEFMGAKQKKAMHRFFGWFDGPQSRCADEQAADEADAKPAAKGKSDQEPSA